MTQWNEPNVNIIESIKRFKDWFANETVSYTYVISPQELDLLINKFELVIKE